ncbi:MAG: carbonic anhydrase family protein [Propionibacteriaceae bacterium]|jgi:carbonic anhydrase|nr:carbonic anhydrase family protein [Propionibacteriaceae bacterium]
MKNPIIIWRGGVAAALALGLALSLTGCAIGSPDPSPTDTVSQSASASSSLEPSSSGSGEAVEGRLDYDDQADWQFISGQMQSPIDIVSADAQPMAEGGGAIQLDYATDPTAMENNGHSIEVADSGSAIIDGRSFTLTQFHFHAASEHTIDGQHYPMEAHFVHKAADGRIAVLAVFFELGEANPGFREVLDEIMPMQYDSTIPHDPPAFTDLMTMIPTDLSYYHYLGSLTTPPLTENVEWYVMKTPVQVSADQVTDFAQLYSHNNRDTQPVDGRVVLDHQA